MRSGFKLSALLRARQAQEDMAKGAVSRSRSARDAAYGVAASREVALSGSTTPARASGRAVVAAIAAQRALAAGLAAARQAVLDAERHHAERMEELAAAARRRRGVERLAERHAAEELRLAQAADQRLIDEIASRGRSDLGGPA
jgi:flagellar biosynthesis chaperone FliJ